MSNQLPSAPPERLIESDDTSDGLKSLRSVQTAYLEKTKNPKITGSYYVNAALSVALLIGDAPALIGNEGINESVYEVPNSETGERVQQTNESV